MEMSDCIWQYQKLIEQPSYVCEIFENYMQCLYRKIKMLKFVHRTLTHIGGIDIMDFLFFLIPQIKKQER